MLQTTSFLLVALVFATKGQQQKQVLYSRLMNEVTDFSLAVLYRVEVRFSHCAELCFEDDYTTALSLFTVKQVDNILDFIMLTREATRTRLSSRLLHKCFTIKEVNCILSILSSCISSFKPVD